jgi:FkbM family methyltransferase
MRQIKGDWWPDRDRTCHSSSYNLEGCEAAARLCKKHDLVIQAGGNCGVWPRHLSGLFARVITFEPSIENYELMQKNILAPEIQGIEMHFAALGEKAGKCGIKLNPENCGDDQTVPGEDVPMVAIDDLKVDPDLIYLDIQGDELPVLKGALETIKRCYPVIGIEIDGHSMRRHGDPRPFLLDLGYEKVGREHQDELFVRKV